MGRNEQVRESLRKWVPTGALFVAAVGLLVKLGWWAPANQLESINAARAARIETDTKLGVIVQQQAAVNASNEVEHKTFRDAVKDLTEKTYQVQLQIKDVQIQILQEIRSAGAAPAGTTYRRGHKVDP